MKGHRHRTSLPDEAFAGRWTVPVLVRLLANELAEDYNLDPEDVDIHMEYLHSGIMEWENGKSISLRFLRNDK